MSKRTRTDDDLLPVPVATTTSPWSLLLSGDAMRSVLGYACPLSFVAATRTCTRWRHMTQQCDSLWASFVNAAIVVENDDAFTRWRDLFIERPMLVGAHRVFNTHAWNYHVKRGSRSALAYKASIPRTEVAFALHSLGLLHWLADCENNSDAPLAMQRRFVCAWSTEATRRSHTASVTIVLGTGL